MGLTAWENSAILDACNILFSKILSETAMDMNIGKCIITGVELEEDDDVEIVSGVIRLNALINGYSYWDGENSILV